MEKVKLIHSETINVSYKDRLNYSKYKRIFDIIASLLLLVLTFPLILISISVVFLQDLKNPFFIQDRVGVSNKEFKVYKIRSMVYNAEKDGPQWAQKNDFRVTYFGKIIRKNKIDELPQLINVLKGEMSLIGPRPEREVFYKDFEKTIPNFRDRLMVKPGITGLAQVNGGYELEPKEKLNFDLNYISNLNLKMDISIILKTIKIIFTKEGAR